MLQFQEHAGTINTGSGGGGVGGGVHGTHSGGMVVKELLY
jgi:hypothetical protein